MGAFNAKEVRKLKNTKSGKKDRATGADDEEDELPSDRRAYAELNQSR